MEKAHFYVLHNTRNGIKAVEVDGFSIHVDGEGFYAYEREDGRTAYIIDPETGLSLYSMYRAEIEEREESEEESWETDLVKCTVEKFKALPGIIKDFKRGIKNYKDQYAEAVKLFQACVKKYESGQEILKGSEEI